MKSANPKITVIIPLFNKQKWINRCVTSILNQSYTNIEILVVNDGSTDNSLAELDKIDDSKIQVINQINGGVSSARNTGIDKASGKYMAFIDADDEWNPMHLYWLVEGFRKFPQAVLTCTDYVEIFDNIKKPVLVKKSNINIHLIDNYLATLATGRFLLSGSSVLIKSSVIIENKLRFNETMILGEDINYWLLLERIGSFVFCDYIGLLYHRVDNNSAMNKLYQHASLTPVFFSRLNLKKYNHKELDIIIKILSREYFNKAYQNRKLLFNGEELLTKIGGGVQIGRYKKFVYLTIRYCPEFIFNILKKIKKTIEPKYNYKNGGAHD